MSVYVDTSAFLAVLDSREEYHAAARETWQQLIGKEEILVVNNYVLVETFALIQNRLGLEAVKAFQQDVVPLLQIDWMDEVAHSASIAALLVANRRLLSLVDCASFHSMRRLELDTVFTFDKHFAEQGFKGLPWPVFQIEQNINPN